LAQKEREVVYYTTGCKPRELQYVPVLKRQSATALPRNLKRLREEKGWSVSRLAKEAEVSASTIRGIEQGVGEFGIPNPTLLVLLKIAIALEVGIEELVEEQKP
jgi:DNA-binding XRE family transcriptional regulator